MFFNQDGPKLNIFRLLLSLVLDIAAQGQKLTKGSIGSDKKCLIAGPSLSLSPQFNITRLVLVLLLRKNVLRGISGVA